MIVSVKYLPLGDVFAINHAPPLILTVIAAVALHERVGWRRWSAVVAGFIGALIMLRPTPAVFQIAALLPLAVAFISAARDAIMRRISITDSSTATLAVTTAVIVPGGTAPSFFKRKSSYSLNTRPSYGRWSLDI